MRRTVFSLCVLLLLAVSPAAHAADVPIPNPGAEKPNGGNEATDWGQNTWGANTAQFTRPSTGAHTGTYSLRVDMSAYSSGDAKWLHAPVEVTGGKYYRSSDFYK